MRRAAFNLLTNDSTLRGLIPEDRWFARSAVPDVPPKPFAVLAWGGKIRRGPGRWTTAMSVLAYQERGSYDTILAVLNRVQVIMENVEDYRWAGERIAQVDVGNYSADLFDDQWRANLMSLDMTLVGGIAS